MIIEKGVIEINHVTRNQDSKLAEKQKSIHHERSRWPPKGQECRCVPPNFRKFRRNQSFDLNELIGDGDDDEQVQEWAMNEQKKRVRYLASFLGLYLTGTALRSTETLSNGLTKDIQLIDSNFYR